MRNGSNSRRGLIRNLAFALALVVIPHVAVAADGTWRVFPEPTFMKPPLSWSIDGAAKTCLVPTVDGTLGPEALSRADFLKLGVPRAEFERRAREAASAALLTLKPEFVRDSDGVILYAVLQSSDGLAASTILAPEFSRMFKDALGEDLVIAVPERDQVLIFSRQDPQYQRMSARIIDSYRDAIYPVSIEAFTFQRGELRAIGEYTR